MALQPRNRTVEKFLADPEKSGAFHKYVEEQMKKERERLRKEQEPQEPIHDEPFISRGQRPD